ncbi:MAG: hypothetical protein AAFN93_22435 [Bacteroidota bacterium]
MKKTTLVNFFKVKNSEFMKNFNNINNFIMVGMVLILLCSPFLLSAQNEGYIYGKITTIDDRTYVGPIRWGKEEVFWTDMFNASKERNENLDYLSRNEREELEDNYRRNNNNGSYWERRVSNWFSSEWNWNDDRYEFKHQFVCQFGEIKSIRPYRRNGADIVLRNGDKVEVDGQGYNDIGSKIRILDPEIGEIELPWDRIDMIEFSQAPSKMDETFGEPLYGSVETYGGVFTGFIQWDHDERVGDDKLDGDSRDGDVSISFGKIASIENDGNRSEVVLNSGRRFSLRGTNDVNNENRGIIVTTKEFGRVDIPWREFKKVTFTKSKGKLTSYDQFGSAKDLSGAVKVSGGETLKGRIVFDLDEEKDYEILQGKDNDIEYLIPFRNIKYLSPKSYRNSSIELKNGTKIVLEDSHDVSDRNSGILVFSGNGDPTYVRWEDVREINFN